MLLPPCTLTFAVALVATGLVCAFTGLDRTSYRLAGVTLAVVMLAAGILGPLPSLRLNPCIVSKSATFRSGARRRRSW